MKLLKLEINAFRGATRPFVLDFDSGKKLTMIFGENGTGKSTIADAFTCLCTNSLGSIQDRSGHEKKFLASALSHHSDVSISLTTDQGSFSATFSGSGFNKNPSVTYPNLRYLRRSQIVKLVDAQPAKRYEELQDYIDVEQIVGSENGLREMIRNLSREYDAQARTLGEATSTIESAWEREGSPLGDWRKWAKAESEKDIVAEQEQIKGINELIKYWEDINSSLLRLQSQQNTLLEKAAALKAIELDLKRAEAEDEEMNQNLLSLLEHAKTHIDQQEALQYCPLCESPVNRIALLNSIQDRLNANKILKELMQRKSQAIREESNAKSLLENLKTQLNRSLLSFANNIESLATFKIPLKKDTLSVEERIQLFEDSKEILEPILAGLNDRKADAERTINQKNLIKSQYDKILQFEFKAKESEALLNAANRAFSIVESTRKDYIEQELESISGEVDTLYQRLHPNENIGSIKLTVKQSARKSVELSGNFQDLTDIAPQSLYSESHLDTLGICVFLALAKKYGNSDTLLVLDDVVMSVDADHLDRFIALLHDLADNFAHVLITTHYRPWRDRYRYHRAPANNVHFVELRRWKFENGMRLQYGKDQIRELHEALESEYFDRQIVAGKAGILLENVLDYLTLTYACRVRRRPGQDYTLGELMDGVAKLSKHLKSERLSKNASGAYDPGLPVQEVALTPYFEELKKLSFIRNQVGAHFNLSGSDVSDGEIESFAKNTLELALQITCPESGAFPDRKDSGAYHETRSKSLRLFPFQEPSK